MKILHLQINKCLIIMICFIIFILNTFINNPCFSQVRNNTAIDTNDYIISPIFSGYSIKSKEELESKFKNENKWDLVIKTCEVKKLRALAGLIKGCISLEIFFAESCNLNNFFITLSDSTANTIRDFVLYDTNNFILPHNISDFKNLKSLYLNCYKLNELSKEIFELKNLIQIGFGGIKFRNIPEGISNLKYLKTFGFKNCNIEEISNDFNQLEKIEEIRFEWCERLNISSICNIISQVKHKIKTLEFYECNIQSLPNEIYLLQNVENIQIMVKTISEEEKNRINNEFPNIKIVIQNE